MILTTTPVDLLSAAIRARGVPLVRLSWDDHYDLHHEPDEVVVERTSGLFRDSFRKRDFTAPCFRWRFSDGRSFAGRPTLKFRRTEWSAFPSSGETYAMDEMPMLRELGEMIHRSWASRVDDHPETTQQRCK